jgi:DNA-binding CsgD family transcriptional regulator
MTPAEEQEFIALWTQGLETAEIARRLSIPPGTVSSRAHVLQLRGKIQARPRGGAHSRRVAQARQAEAGVSARTPLPMEWGKSVRWNLHLSEGLRERIKVQAKARGLQDSQMVEELLWLALAVVEEEER